jgi:O-antigen ligase
MTAMNARLGAERGPGLALGVAALALFGVLCGVGVAMGELQALIGAVTLVACVGVLIDFRVGAVLLMALLPIEQSYIFPHGMFGFTGLNPLNVLLVVTLLSYLARGRDLGRFMPKQLLWLLVAPIVIAGLIGTRYVDDIYPFFYETEVIHFTNAIGYLRDIAVKPLLMVIAALLIGAALSQSKKAERFLVPIIVSVWVMCVMAISYVVASGVSLGTLATANERGFFSGIGMHANDLGRLYAVAYGLLLFTWGETRDYALKTLLLVTMAVLAIALVLTFSRGAMVGFVLVNAMYILWKFNAKTLGIALVAGAVALPLLPGAVWSRLGMGISDGGDVNALSAGRIDEIWLPLLPELFKSPLWGNGLDSVMWARALWAEQMIPVTHPHNAYIQAVLDMGLIGLGLLIAFYWHVYRGFRDLGGNAYLSPTMRGFYQGAVAGLLCFLITGFAGSSLRPTPEFAFLWIAIGMMYGQLGRRVTPENRAAERA